MKKIINILITVFTGAAMLCACNDPYGELSTGYEAKFIDVTEVVYDYDAFPGSSTLRYTCPETVTVSSNQAWCTVTKLAEGEMKLEIAANKTIATRNAIVTLKTAGGDVSRIPVTQRGIVLTVSPASVRIPQEGGSATVEVNSPVEFLHSTTASWLSGKYTVDGTSITIELPANNTIAANKGVIEIELPEQQLKANISVEQLGSTKGFELAKKFIGPANQQTAWYFDPAAGNGPSFNSAFTPVSSTGQYKYVDLKIGRFDVSGWYQALRITLSWKLSSGSMANYTTGYRIDMTEGETDDLVVFQIKFDAGAATDFWGNDHYFYNGASGVKGFLTNLTGVDIEKSKTYRIIDTDDTDNPTRMTLADIENGNNWFSVSTTPTVF